MAEHTLDCIHMTHDWCCMAKKPQKRVLPPVKGPLSTKPVKNDQGGDSLNMDR